MIKKILIAEDEVDIVTLLDAIFGDLVNYETLYAKDGQEAVNSARVDNPDIILLDIQLPELNGYEVCRLLKSNPTLSRIKVLMLSGMTQNHDWLKAQEAGADDFIAKPFSAITLLEKVEELLKSNEGS
jgi:DNA-binding response OmpR family regulator